MQLHAAAAVCNLVLEFSAVKDAVLANGGMKRLVTLTSSELPALRLHSTWALRNMVYKSETGIRTAFMQVGFGHASRFLAHVWATKRWGVCCGNRGS